MAGRFRRLCWALAAATAFALAACGETTSPRGLFTGYVMDKTEAEIIEKIGKPAAEDRKDPDQVRLIYHRRTFDPDNFNQVDEKTTILLRPKDGKLVAFDIIFG